MWVEMMKKRYPVLIPVLVIAVTSAIALREFAVYKAGGRPESEFLEYAFQWFSPRRNYIIAQMSMDSAISELRVGHRWRGKYQFYLWVPDEIRDCKPVSEALGVRCEVFNHKGVLVYCRKELPSKNVFWFKDKIAMKRGSLRSVCAYWVPSNVPLDEPCRVVITLTGDVEVFMEKYKEVRLVMKKVRDK